MRLRLWASTYCTPGSATYLNINSPIYCSSVGCVADRRRFRWPYRSWPFCRQPGFLLRRGEEGFSVNGHVLERRRAFVKRWQEYLPREAAYRAEWEAYERALRRLTARKKNPGAGKSARGCTPRPWPAMSSS